MVRKKKGPRKVKKETQGIAGWADVCKGPLKPTFQKREGAQGNTARR